MNYTEFHPISNIFPMMLKSEILSLADDIKANGLLEPIIIFEEKILAGEEIKPDREHRRLIRRLTK